jgi:hypothetical protein
MNNKRKMEKKKKDNHQFSLRGSIKAMWKGTCMKYF